MKSLIFVFGIALLVSSCKKHWTCECTYTYQLGSYTQTSTTVEESEKISKKNAEVWCDQQTFGYSGYSRSCKLQ